MDVPIPRPQAEQQRRYAAMGRTDLDLTWEKIDKIDALKAAVAGK